MPISSADVHIGEGSGAGAASSSSSNEDEVRVRESVFLVTVNTNVRSKDSKVMKRKVVEFYNTMEALLQDPAFAARAIDVIPMEDSFQANVIAFISSTGVEYSARSGLHSHSTWKILHTTRLRVALNPLRIVLKEKFPSWTKLYVNVRFVKSGESAAREYVFKNVRGKRMRVPREISEHPQFGQAPIVTSEIQLSDSIVL